MLLLNKGGTIWATRACIGGVPKVWGGSLLTTHLSPSSHRLSTYLGNNHDFLSSRCYIMAKGKSKQEQDKRQKPPQEPLSDEESSDEEEGKEVFSMEGFRYVIAFMEMVERTVKFDTHGS